MSHFFTILTLHILLRTFTLIILPSTLTSATKKLLWLLCNRILSVHRTMITRIGNIHSTHFCQTCLKYFLLILILLLQMVFKYKKFTVKILNCDWISLISNVKYVHIIAMIQASNNKQEQILAWNRLSNRTKTSYHPKSRGTWHSHQHLNFFSWQLVIASITPLCEIAQRNKTHLHTFSRAYE